MNRLRPFDILVIQTAIEEYKKKYPERPTPSAEVALEWRLGRQRRRNAENRANTNGEPNLLRSIWESFRALF
jgi:hypothetical protein